MAQALISDGISPLEIMTTTMRDLWAEASAVPGKPNLSKRMQAVMLAEKCAPYLHPRLSAVTASDPNGKPLKSELTLPAAALKSIVKALQSDC